VDSRKTRNPPVLSMHSVNPGLNTLTGGLGRANTGQIVGGREKTKRLDIWFDPVNERFELRRPSKGENWVKLSEILQIRKRAELESLLRERGFGPNEQDRISTLWRVFREDYNVPVHELSEDVDLDDLGTLFVRINFAGTRVRGQMSTQQ